MPRCSSGRLIVRAYDLAVALRQAGVPVVGAFHGPIERECRDLLLRGEQPLVVCVPRGMWKRPPAVYLPGIAAGRLLLCAPFPEREERITAATAERANRVAVALAAGVFIIYATPGGTTATLCAEARAWGKPVWTLADDANAALVAMGARAVGPADIPAVRDELIAAGAVLFT